MNSDEQVLRNYLDFYPVLDLNEVSYDVYKLKNRIIFNPNPDLKRAQRFLKKCLNKKYPLMMTTVNCAKIHSGKKWVLKMDIKDFYGSVRIDDIRKIMSKVHPLEIVSDYLTDLVTTMGNKLPTGAPTSAHIANACFLVLDKQIIDYCRMRDVRYSRYMDDLTFSADNKNVLNSVEDYVADIIQSCGFRLNEKKTRYISSNKQQNVLGIVVNKDVRIPKKMRRKIRAMLHHYYMSQKKIVPRVEKFSPFGESDISRLKGYLNYVKSVDKKTYEMIVIYSVKLNIHFS